MFSRKGAKRINEFSVFFSFLSSNRDAGSSNSGSAAAM